MVIFVVAPDDIVELQLHAESTAARGVYTPVPQPFSFLDSLFAETVRQHLAALRFSSLGIAGEM